MLLFKYNENLTLGHNLFPRTVPVGVVPCTEVRRLEYRIVDIGSLIPQRLPAPFSMTFPLVKIFSFANFLKQQVYKPQTKTDFRYSSSPSPVP